MLHLSTNMFVNTGSVSIVIDPPWAMADCTAETCNFRRVIYTRVFNDSFTAFLNIDKTSLRAISNTTMRSA
jgi:hypothetical protein